MARSRLIGFPILVAALVWVSASSAQMTQDQMAEMILSSARKAYNEKQYPVAATRFREFIAKFGNHKDTPVARYGLALTLLEGPERDHNAALEQRLGAALGNCRRGPTREQSRNRDTLQKNSTFHVSPSHRLKSWRFPIGSFSARDASQPPTKLPNVDNAILCKRGVYLPRYMTAFAEMAARILGCEPLASNRAAAPRRPRRVST